MCYYLHASDNINFGISVSILFSYIFYLGPFFPTALNGHPFS